MTRTLEVSDIGELVLLDGRKVGHRDLNTYYKQNYKPADNRPSILAQKREELLRLESMFGALKMDPSSIERLSDAQVVSLIRQERKTEKKALMLAQRSQLKQQNNGGFNEGNINLMLMQEDRVKTSLISKLETIIQIGVVCSMMYDVHSMYYRRR